MTDRDLATVITQLATWDAGDGYVFDLHAGDLGWSSRQPPGLELVEAWWEDDELVAVALLDDDSARPRVRRDRLDDRDLARRVADRVDSLAAPQVWSEAQPRSLLRQDLVLRGWTTDPNPWLAFHFDGRDRGAPSPEVRLAQDDVAGRVAVQRAGFAGSTFDESRWHRMAAGPGYRPDLDLVVLDPVDGQPGAGVTAWLSVPGGTATIEPLATHPDHRGRGLGRAAVRAVTAACLAAGASGVSVCTPAANTAGVATYLSAGFLVMESVAGLTREGSSRPGG